MIALGFIVDDDDDDPGDDDDDPDDYDDDPADDDDDPDDDDVVTQSWGEGRTIQPASAQWSHRQFTAACNIYNWKSWEPQEKRIFTRRIPPKKYLLEVTGASKKWLQKEVSF